MIRKSLLHSVFAKLKYTSRLISTTPKTLSNDFILVHEINNAGVLVLNRPKALNATDLDMLQKLLTNIQKWSETKSLIIVKNVGKAFSAGGDLRSLVELDENYGQTVFRTEYTMNHTIANLNIPYVAIINGITMGGGIGISLHGKYCIATENTLVAMPESGIGLFPDVGVSHFFPRLPGKLGYYLGLTGYRLKGQDVLHAGMATHYIESAKIPELEKGLLQLKNKTDVDGFINDFCSKVQSEFVLSKHLDQISKSFDASSVEEILSNLERDNSEWAKQTIKTLRSLCPTSLKVLFHNLKLGENKTLAECLQMEFRLAVRLVQSKNFKEGVRALLIAKDNDPKWDPARIEDVTEEQLLPLYEPLPIDDKLPI